MVTVLLKGMMDYNESNDGASCQRLGGWMRRYSHVNGNVNVNVQRRCELCVRKSYVAITLRCLRMPRLSHLSVCTGQFWSSAHGHKEVSTCPSFTLLPPSWPPPLYYLIPCFPTLLAHTETIRGLRLTHHGSSQSPTPWPPGGLVHGSLPYCEGP